MELGTLTINKFGFKQHEFLVNGCKAIVVEPNNPLPGKLWVWRAEFFDYFQETVFALVEAGYYLAYIEVGNTFGAPDALKNWDVFYEYLTKELGFAKKMILEGMSRGGLYIYNWASRNTDKVAVIYGDAPVCDFKSWPAGIGKGEGSKEDWEKLINDYHFKGEEEALAYPFNPIDNLEEIAKAKIPIIHVYGDVDELVPHEENTIILAERYRKLGGDITLIPKPGIGHHPHGLENDPSPLVNYMLEKTKGL